MLKDIVGIKLQGANFLSETKLDLFNPIKKEEDKPNHKKKIISGALIYGRNGTGKSTIAKTFRKISGENTTSIELSDFIDKNESSISLTEEEKKSIFVFDEDFVDKNVKLREDGLETIIMLGEMADLTEKIEDAEKKYKSLKENFDCKKKEYDEYCDEKNEKSPEYYNEKIKKALQGDDNWAGRDRIISNAKTNADVRDDTYKKFLNRPSKTKDELLIDYKTKIEELDLARNKQEIIDNKVPVLPDIYTKYDNDKLYQLLAIKIEKPEFSEREIKLFSLLQKEGYDKLLQRSSLFKKEETIECPYCYQPLEPKYKKTLVDSIEIILNKEVQEHKDALDRQKIETIELDLNSYEKLEGFEICNNLIKKINNIINENNENINKKINNPYEPITVTNTDIKLLIKQLEKALCDLERVRNEYNDKIKNIEPLVEELLKINNDIAHYEINDYVLQFEKHKKEYDEIKKSYEEIKQECEKTENIIKELNAQKRNVNLAIDSINACMKYIFFAEDRLELKYEDESYKLLSRGRYVKPSDVSSGERNIIGLSYFFTSIFTDQEEKEAYKKEYLIVIDDPVSSFDMENRIGIISFLKYKINSFLEGNSDTKILIMTHDLLTFYDLIYIYNVKNKTYKFNLLEIHKETLKQFSYDKNIQK